MRIIDQASNEVVRISSRLHGDPGAFRHSSRLSLLVVLLADYLLTFAILVLLIEIEVAGQSVGVAQHRTGLILIILNHAVARRKRVHITIFTHCRPATRIALRVDICDGYWLGLSCSICNLFFAPTLHAHRMLVLLEVGGRLEVEACSGQRLALTELSYEDLTLL